MICSMLKLPCSQAVVEGNDPEWAILFLYGAVHAHDFRLTLRREQIEELRESCEIYLKRTADLVLNPEDLARARFDEAATHERFDPDSI